MARRLTPYEKARRQFDGVENHIFVMDEVTYHVDPSIATCASPDEARRLLDHIKRIREWLDAVAQHAASVTEAA